MHSAYVLHRWPFREHSLLVDAFSRREGRMRVIAKGARNSKKGHGALLQPFQPLLLDWRGKSDLKTVVSIEAEQTLKPLQGRYLYSGFYMNELLQRLLPEQVAVPGLFDDYHRSLALLRDEVRIEPVLRRFEWLLLQHLQLDFDWYSEVDEGAPIRSELRYYFRPGEGFACVLHGREPTPHFTGAAILKMAEFALQDEDLLRQFKWLMRQALAVYLGTKPLRSRELFQSNSARFKPAPSD